MELDQVKLVVEGNYNISIKEIEKIKNVYKIKTEKDIYCLKVIKYEYPHFLFILKVIKHLQNRGFEKIPLILRGKNQKDFISLGGCFAYLTPWIDARECNYDNPLDISTATVKLAELHNKSCGFQVSYEMKPRIGWFKWIENFNTRKNEILNFRNKIYTKQVLTDFDRLYLENMEEELGRCDNAVEKLVESDYLSKMRLEIDKKGVCHHDFAHHNVLIEKDRSVSIIDFDYTILDTHLHDLSSLLIRRMKNGKWDKENALFILDSYNSVYKVEKNDIPIMSAFIEFPQDYWQIGIQYYWEEHLREDDFFIKRLMRIYEDSEERQDFTEEFRSLKYKG